jgi:hypothetical protein
VLGDALVQSYAAWQEATREAQGAYRHWADATTWNPEGFFAYIAALDREEQAARIYADAVGRIRAQRDRTAPPR